MKRGRRRIRGSSGSRVRRKIGKFTKIFKKSGIKKLSLLNTLNSGNRIGGGGSGGRHGKRRKRMYTIERREMPRMGQYWYGPYGFLYKKNTGVGGRKNPPYGLICNRPYYLYNKYRPGQSGIGGQSTAVRRAKNRRSTVCNGQQNVCGTFYPYLGQYDNYTGNPNGYFPLQYTWETPP